MAVFDWLPKNVTQRGIMFYVEFAGASTSGVLERHAQGGPDELTIRLLRSARLSGVVHLPDGRPARQILVIAGFATGFSLKTAARTDDEGRYLFDNLVPDHQYMVTVNDESWAAPSLVSSISREGQEQRGLDFTLIKGTLIHGRVTEGSDHRPSKGTVVSLSEEGELLPKEHRTVSRNKYGMHRGWSSGPEGRYQFRVGPGHYKLQASSDDRTEPVTVEVKNEAEIVRDLSTKGSARPTFFSGLVIQKTASGDRPINKAWVFRWPVDGRYFTDAEGRFAMERQTSGETMLYAFCPDKGLAGFVSLSTEADNVTVVVSQTGTVTGRVIDSNGKPWAKQRIRVELAKGPYSVSTAHFAVSALMTDDQGRFTYKDGPVGSAGEFSAFHQKDGPTIVPFQNRGPRTVVAFEIRDLEPVDVPDLVVPAEKTAK